jgi:hypothetical protein
LKEVVFINSKETIEEWQAHIEQQLASGKTQLQWCEENGIKVYKFRYWKKRLMSKLDPDNDNINFVGIKPAAVPRSSKMRISIGNATIEIDDDVNPVALSTVIKVLSDYV